jgi:hypothetical protein
VSWQCYDSVIHMLRQYDASVTTVCGNCSTGLYQACDDFLWRWLVLELHYRRRDWSAQTEFLNTVANKKEESRGRETQK